MEMFEKRSEIFEAAKSILDRLLGLLGVAGSVVLSDEFTLDDDDGAPASVGLNILGDDLGILIGRRGQTMAALQQMVRLIMAHQHQVRLPIVLDVEGYKQRRCEGLRMLAERLAGQVSAKHMPFTMEPMSPFERRIVHLALADHPDVITESTGVGEARKVVILPKVLPSN